jgi:two-component system LytT family sensor kinase
MRRSQLGKPPLRKRASGWLILFAIWLLVVLFSATRVRIPEEALYWRQAVALSAIQWLVWAFAAVLIVRIDRLSPGSRDKLLPRLLWHIPWSLLVPVLTTYVTVVLAPLALSGTLRLPRLIDVLRDSWSTGFYTHVVIYWAITGVYIAWDYNRRLTERQLKAAHLERMVAESQLHTLKTQLHPHFLFNSLNAISAYVERNPRLARRMLEQLGALLRLSLDYSNSNEIPLERELAFLENYIGLQEARYSGRLEVHWQIDAAASEAMVPTLILQPLVENAIIHGIATRSDKGAIVVGVRKEQERLHISVEDDGTGLPPGWDLERNGGVGLNNTRERLRWLYGDAAHTLEVSDGPAGRGVRVDIILPFHRAEIPVAQT